MPTPPVPSALLIDLFRAVEDVHDMTGALVVLLVDAEGRSVAVSGDEDDFPPPIRGVLTGKRLAGAGSVRELLSPVVADLAGSPVNVSVHAVEADAHVLAIAFDSDADLTTVQEVGREAASMIAERLARGE